MAYEIKINETPEGDYRYILFNEDKVISKGFANTAIEAISNIERDRKTVELNDLLKFKDYYIEYPTFLDDLAPDQYEYKTRWKVCKKNKDSRTNFVIASFWWNNHKSCWKFESVDTRYLEHCTEGLNEWVLSVMSKIKEIRNDFEGDE